MTQKKPDYLYRKGPYVYFRHPIFAKPVALPRDETSQEFKNAYAPLLKAVENALKGKPATPPAVPGAKVIFRPASIGWLIDKFKQSATWAGYSDGTRNQYGYALDLLKSGDLGPVLLHDMKPEHVDVYSAKIAKERGGSVADQQVNLITNLWEFAKGVPEFKRKGKHCPTMGATRHYQHDGTGHLGWPDAVLVRFDETAPHYLVEYKTGLHYTGQRGCDVVTMRWDDYDGELINVIQQKTGERVWLVCPDPLREMLDRMKEDPKHPEFIFVNKWGRPYKTAGSLSDALTDHLRSLGYYDVTMHGLRKNAGMELALAGCSVGEIQTVLGHKSPAMAIFYCKQADKKRLSYTATQKWNAEIKARKVARVAERRGQMRPVKA